MAQVQARTSRSLTGGRLGKMVQPHEDALRLVLISVLSLYFELTLIRWIPTQVRLLAYFTNFVLIAALLGLGLGMLLAGRRARLAAYFPSGLLALALLVLLLKRWNIVLPVVAEGQVVWGYLHNLPATGVVAYLALIAFFLAMVTAFVLVGQEIGRALRDFTPLHAYSLNILGSLLGVLAFALVSHLEVSPTVWFAVGCLGFAVYLLLTIPAWRWFVLVAVPLVPLLVAVHADASSHTAGSVYWSPYYEIEVVPQEKCHDRVGYEISVNKDSHQQPLDLSRRNTNCPYVTSRRTLYDLPYTLVHPKNVLVLGAGTGNDVAATLRTVPTAQIDAVEIDPVIARLGRKIHPEHPYDHAGVRLHVDDARSFLQRNATKYDLVVFGFLDSHRLFSHMSSVRMDNYVYTRENLDSVRRHLTPRGIVAMTFTVHEKWIADRIFTVLTTVFGHTPLVYEGDRYSVGTTFLIGLRRLHVPPGAPIFTHAQFAQTLAYQHHQTWNYTQAQGYMDGTWFSTRADLLTDDWPYLYLRERVVPPNYLIVLVMTALVSILVVWLLVPRIDFRRAANWNFFLLGAAFALQETKGITDIALLFGSTWITNVIVISAILMVILLANIVVRQAPAVPLQWVYLALVASLVFNFFVSPRGLLEFGFWVQVFASGLRVAGPLFFSGIIFARWFESTESPSSALGANLMGAVVGGLSEYSSLALGLNPLYLLALAFYLLSMGLVRAASIRQPGPDLGARTAAGLPGQVGRNR